MLTSDYAEQTERGINCKVMLVKGKKSTAPHSFAVERVSEVKQCKFLKSIALKQSKETPSAASRVRHGRHFSGFAQGRRPCSLDMLK